MTREEARGYIREQWEIYINQITQPAKKKVNRRQTYICPLCGNGSGEKGDGITLNPRAKELGSLKCFTCGFSGDIIDLFRAKFNSDYLTVLNELADASGLIIDGRQSNFSLPAQKKKATPAPAPVSDPVDFRPYYEKCRACLETSEEAKKYLESRNISLDTARRFWIGFDAAADPAGAPGAVKDDDRRKMHTCPRLIIPVTDSYYIARSIVPIDAGLKALNPKGCSIGIFNYKELHRTQYNFVFVVEGVFDALSLLDAGAPAIALNSTSNAETLLKMLSETPIKGKALILCLDNDDSGRRATETLKTGLEALRIPFIVSDICPGFKDPNEAYTNDRLSFLSAITEAATQAGALASAAASAETDTGNASDQEPAKDPKEAGPAIIDNFLQTVISRDFEPIPTGIKTLDKALQGGFIRKTLVILQAAPGMGKTALSQWIFENMAAAGHDVIYINLEMAREQLIARSLSRICWRNFNGDIDALQILRGYAWTNAQRETIRQAAEFYKNHIAERFLYNPGGTTNNIDDILQVMENAAARATAEGRPAPIVCIDYLHIIDFDKSENADGIKRALKAFKDFAIKEKTVVFAISATNREANKSGTAELESGRDTSAIEYSGDLNLSLVYTAIDDREKTTEFNNKTKKEIEREITKDDILQAYNKAIKEGRTIPDDCRRLSVKVLKSRFTPANYRARLIFDGKHACFLDPGDSDDKRRDLASGFIETEKSFEEL